MSEYTVAVQAGDVWGVEAEWTFDNPPAALEVLRVEDVGMALQTVQHDGLS